MPGVSPNKPPAGRSPKSDQTTDYSQPFKRQFSQIKDAAGRLGRARDAFLDPNAMKAAVKNIASGSNRRRKRR